MINPRIHVHAGGPRRKFRSVTTVVSLPQAAPPPLLRAVHETCTQRITFFPMGKVKKSTCVQSCSELLLKLLMRGFLVRIQVGELHLTPQPSFRRFLRAFAALP